MSRPFSYSDEDFTVIGNVLFCHIKIRKTIVKTEPIVDIPPEIYDHMLFHTQKFIRVSAGTGFLFTGNAVDVGVKTKDGKYFLYAQVDIYETGTYLVGFYILKDI